MSTSVAMYDISRGKKQTWKLKFDSDAKKLGFFENCWKKVSTIGKCKTVGEMR